MSGRRHLATAISLCALAAAATGCGDQPGPADSPQAGSAVTYSRTGGIAGIDERLRIEADGSAVLTLGIEGQQTAFELSDDELAQLRDQLEAADLGSVDVNSPPTGCADCFIYELGYGGRTISYDESRPAPEPVTAVVSHLGELVAAHSPADPAAPADSVAPPAGG